MKYFSVVYGPTMMFVKKTLQIAPSQSDAEAHKQTADKRKTTKGRALLSKSL